MKTLEPAAMLSASTRSQATRVEQVIVTLAALYTIKAGFTDPKLDTLVKETEARLKRDLL